MKYQPIAAIVFSEGLVSILFAYRELREMDKSDRIRACYQHACLRFVSNKQMTNESLRKRFAINDKNYSMASRIIADTIAEGECNRNTYTPIY